MRRWTARGDRTGKARRTGGRWPRVKLLRSSYTGLCKVTPVILHGNANFHGARPVHLIILVIRRSTARGDRTGKARRTGGTWALRGSRVLGWGGFL